MPIEWKKRCKKDSTTLSDRKIWETKCKGYKVIFSHIRFGENSDSPLPDVYYAIEVSERGENIISKHRKKNPAMKSCEKHAKSKE